MTNKCVVAGCKTGENKKKRKRNQDVPEFENDDKNDDETTDETTTKKKKSMLDPVPDIYPGGYAPSSSLLPSSSCTVPRKPPTDR